MELIADGWSAWAAARGPGRVAHDGAAVGSGGGRGTGDGGRGRKALRRPPGAGVAGAPVGACAWGPLARAMIGCGPGAGGLGPPSSPAGSAGAGPPCRARSAAGRARGGVHRRAAARAAARAPSARPKIRRLDADPVLRERVVDPPGGPGPVPRADRRPPAAGEPDDGGGMRPCSQADPPRGRVRPGRRRPAAPGCGWRGPCAPDAPAASPAARRPEKPGPRGKEPDARGAAHRSAPAPGATRGPCPGTGRQTRSSPGDPRQRPDHPGGGAAAGSR